MKQDYKTLDEITHALRAVRNSSVVPSQMHADQVWIKHQAWTARSARRRRHLAAVSVAAVLFCGSAISMAGVDRVLNTVRVVLSRINVVGLDDSGQIRNSEVVIDAFAGASVFDALAASSGTIDGVRTGVLVEDLSLVEMTEDESGIRVVGRNVDGSIAGMVVVSPDGKAIAASGDAYIGVVVAPNRDGDVNGDAVVDLDDLASLLRRFATECDCAEDINEDGRVDRFDLEKLLPLLE